MPGVPFSRTNWSTREEVLTSDLNRLQILEARDLLDALGDDCRTDESRGANPQNDVGARVEGAGRLPTMASAAAFTMDLTFGQAFWNDAGVTDVASGAEDSQYKVVRWAAQNVPFTTPDAGLPRIDLVVATPALVLTDSASRNILTDPVARTIAPANVFKSANPLAAVTVVAGTPNAQPVAPAVPAGALALFEVYIPAAAANSTTFKLSRRVQRRAVSVTGTYHGILRNCNLLWDVGIDETATASNIAIDSAAAGQISRVVIDGEVITFKGLDQSSATITGVIADAGANSPYAAAAPAGNDKPYYIYLVGGRNAPQGTLSSGVFNPVVLVESLVAPNRDGRPSAVITHPRGGTTQAGALYIGIGFVVKNSTRRKACFIQADWVYALTGVSGTVSPSYVAAFFDSQSLGAAALTAATMVSMPLNSKPTPSDRALIWALYTNSDSGGGSSAIGRPNVTTPSNAFVNLSSRSSNPDTKEFQAFLDGATGGLKMYPDPGFATGALRAAPRAYNMHVPRLSE